MELTLKEKDIVVYLHEYQEHKLVHFEQLEDGRWLVIYGPNISEGFTGMGKTLGEAIYEMVQAIANDCITNETPEDGSEV